ncbi:MAG TPA: TIGR00730 family Rossman fold protein [Bacteroidales bacterium]|nr:TIGR00730 family Rossman fold protein [Bacteroidales bacterium]
MKKIYVYCASSSKVNSEYVETARKLGKILAENNIELVYGGGSVGLMGVLADSVLENGGRVTGVIPRFMVEVEWQHDGLTELILTESMHERKEKMAELADAVVALPGGCGTLEELLEIITWKQLGIHSLPIIIVNVNGYYNHLLAQFQQAADELFMRPEHLQMWNVTNSAEEVLKAISNGKTVHRDMRRFAKI